MTREEQIKKQADIYTDDASNYAEWCEGNGWVDINDIELVEKAFISGANWADANPYLYEEEQVGMGGLGMIWQKKALIKKACEWIEQYLFDLGYPDDWCRDSPNIESGKERFIKAMKGE